MPFHTAKDHRGRTRPIIGPGWRVLWPFDRVVRADAPSSPQIRAANAVPRPLRGRLLGWSFAVALMLALVGRVVYANFGGSPVANWGMLGFLAPVLIGAVSFWRELRSANSGIVASALAEAQCPSCGYSLASSAKESDNCRICPECGSAWQLGDAKNQRTDAATAKP